MNYKKTYKVSFSNFSDLETIIEEIRTDFAFGVINKIIVSSSVLKYLCRTRDPMGNFRLDINKNSYCGIPYTLDIDLEGDFIHTTQTIEYTQLYST